MILLCVDDDPDDVEIFREAVKELDPSYICIVARNGKEALETLHALTPDMVFLDINMPVMNGRDTLRNIRADESLKCVPVCILSTHITDSDARQYRQMGAVACLIKPRSFSAFSQMIQTVLQEGVEKSARKGYWA